MILAAAALALGAGMAGPEQSQPPSIRLAPAKPMSDEEKKLVERYQKEMERRRKAGDIVGAMILTRPRSERAVLCSALAEPFRMGAQETNDAALREQRIAEAQVYAEKAETLAQQHAPDMPVERRIALKREGIQMFGIMTMQAGTMMTEKDIKTYGDDGIVYIFAKRVGARCLELVEDDPFTPPEAG
ncbi:hypothetical protein [Qipengyuania aquimaris]|uniref:hypothetical protein n=1 Tax=Qipengyuania aquimaris TaxID=255984 RepID=UPI001CD2AA5C|nr:hypothetical protein [Qipengyuania aquimaris]MCA0902602.1 hypothetical protein [Qipengyuania aquimaris]